MKHAIPGIAIIVACVCAYPADAQLFAKKSKVNPSQRVPELIVIVKTDPDEKKRAQAAEELRDYDATKFTEIVPVLVDVLKHDKKLSVRLESLGSLSRIRPVSTLAGQAIEKAAAEDESWRVRLQAKTSLPRYHLAGYSSKRVEPTPATRKTTTEPPRSNPRPTPSRVDTTFPRPLPPGVAVPPTQQGPSLFP